MFRQDSATAMAVYFLKSAPDHQLGDLVLMKLMVIAERQCMAQTTSLITGADFVSMQNGPVLSEVLDLMKNKNPSTLWNQCIEFVPYAGGNSTSNHCVLKCDLDVDDYLSEFEIGLLHSVWTEYGGNDKWDLVNLTHTFPEWDASCAQTKSSRPISLEEIFKLGLHEDPELARERAEEIQYFEAVTA
jgi:uncharacterized phage-associated protein